MINDLNEDGGFADLGGGVGRQRRDQRPENFEPVFVGSPVESQILAVSFGYPSIFRKNYWGGR